MENKSNLIVNYLPQTLTDEEFRSMFLSIGTIKSSKIVRDKATGYSYGFGFVDYVKEDDAQRAIQTLNGLQLQNKRIKVALSRSGESIKGANLYIRNIPRTMSQEDLSNAFCQYGQVIQARILEDQNTGQSKGVGFVLFDSKEQADNAMESMNGEVLEGGTEGLSIKYAEDNKGKARPPSMGGAPAGRGGRGGRGGGAGGGGGGGGGYGANDYGNGYQGGYVEPLLGGGYRGGYGGEPPMSRGGRGGRGASYGGPMRSRGGGNRYNPMTGNYPPAANAGGGGGGGGLGSNEGGFVLFVYNVGPTTDERALWQLFSPYGTIQKVNVIRDHSKDQGKGYGFVSMTNYHDAMGAIQALNGYNFAGKPLQVSFKTPKG